jgi:DNA-binding LacI/PurR family transcriptional regulator
MSVTIKEIANICGVSRGTVDRALNNRPNINPETKKYIIKTAKELGYRPHFLAKSLSTGKTNTIGIIVFDVYNEYFSHLIHSSQQKSLDENYGLNIMVSNKNKKQELMCIDNLLERNVDGIIINSINNNTSYINKLKNSNKPIVSIGNRIDSHIPFVGINDYQAMYDSTEYVISQGYDNVIFVCPPLQYKNKQNIYAPSERYRGYNDCILSLGLKSKVIKDKDYVGKIHHYLNNSSKKIAFLCSSDIFALNVMREVKSVYGHIPNNIGIMGFDNLSMLQYISPILTTVSYPLTEVGNLAVTSILNQINENKKKDYILKHSIVVGETI